VAFLGSSQGLSIEHLEARLLANEQGLCVDALAARVDGSPPGSLPPVVEARAAQQGVTLALTDRATDGRWEFRCTP
jgi:hypothetical protein